MNDEINLLNEIYSKLLESYKIRNEKLQNNLNRIQEIDVYLSSIRQDSDISMFSPRSTENIFADRIKEFNTEKSDLEIENKKQLDNLNELKLHIEKLEQLLKCKNSSFNHLDIINIQEKERQRIARELHDSTVQNLIHIGHMIELSIMYMDQDTVEAKLELEKCNRILKFTINEIRDIIFNLRPMSFDDLGFKQSIENFIENCKVQYKNCEIEYDICDLEDVNCKNKDSQEINLILVTIYRVIQEAVVNALKHSNADKITLKINKEDRKFYINIKDNGKGFSLDDVMNKKNKHFGLSIMKERINLLHGNINIDTEINKGTEVKIDIPLNKRRKHEYKSNACR